MTQESKIVLRDQLFMTAVLKEVERARTLFPGNKHMLAAFNEEVGEVNKAFLDREFGKTNSAHIVTECVQAAAMALRCATEGDASFMHGRTIETGTETGHIHEPTT